jgi:hypothetical protein
VEVVISKRRPTASTAGPLKHLSQKPLRKAIETGVVPLNNSNIHNHSTACTQSSSRDHSGFIDSTYTAAEVDTLKDQLIVKGSNQVAYVSSTIGGSLSQISFESSKPSSRTDSTYGGGIRGKIRGFSRVSRRNLLRKLSSINRTAFRASKGRLIFATLTYPTDYPEDPKVCKKHLDAFRKRLQREYGDLAAFWRMGIQKRGAYHFHLLLFVPPSFGPLKEVRQFIASCWYMVCGEVGEGHLPAGTNAEEIRAWKKATSCVEKYMAKEEEFPEKVQTGRVWGVWNEGFLPIQWETVRVSREVAYRIRRVYRKLARRTGTGFLGRMTVFVRYENVLRLLDFLGYRQEE